MSHLIRTHAHKHDAHKHDAHKHDAHKHDAHHNRVDTMTTARRESSSAPPNSSGHDQSNGGESKPAPEREFWSSRVAFYFATAGAAIGFGNVWRFPGLSVQYGGGAFFVPYLLALVFIGIPLTVLEIGFGQYFQTGDIGVFGKPNEISTRKTFLFVRHPNPN